MRLIGFLRKKRPRKTRVRRGTASPWLKKVVKEESTQEYVATLIKTNSVVQAAVVHALTGIEINPADIKIPSPLEEFERAITNEAIRNLCEDPEFMAMATDVVMKLMYEGFRQRLGLGKGPPGGRGNDLNDGCAGQPPMDWISVIDKVDRLRAKLGGGNTLQTVLNSPVLVNIMKTLIPLLLGGRNAQAEGAARPAVIAVDVDGELVEMTLEAYEIYKQQSLRLANLAAKSGSKAEVRARGDSVPGAPGGASSDGTPNSPAPEGAPSESNSSVSAASTPAPAPPEASAGTMPSELSDTMRAGIVLVAKEALADIETKTPLEYADNLKAQAAQGNNLAQSILAFLGSGVTYEDIVKKVQPYKRYDDLRPYIEKLEQKKGYILGVISAISAVDPGDHAAAV